MLVNCELSHGKERVFSDKRSAIAEGHRVARLGVSDRAGLTEALAQADLDGDAEFYMVLDAEHDYPLLVLCVSCNRWYLHYWPQGDVPGFHSLGDDPSEQMAHLPAGDNIWVLVSTLVDINTALEAAEQFMATGRQPTCLSWFKL